MPDYWQNRTPGGTYFFTAKLLDRSHPLLVEHVDILRISVRRVRELIPFHIDAWVVLPERMHAILTLPSHDSHFSRRWQAIEMAFSKRISTGEARSASRARRESAAFGSGAMGAHDPWQPRLRGPHGLRPFLSGK